MVAVRPRTGPAAFRGKSSWMMDYRGPLPNPLNRGCPWLPAIVALIMSLSAAAEARHVNGYRSAEFGMDEAAVLEAIEADFVILAEDVERSVNAVQMTTSLTIMVKDLVNYSGRTEVAYLFGYRSKKLIQVNLMWRVTSKFFGATPRLKWVARAMANRIALWGIPRHVVKPNTKTEDGATLLFRGQGESGIMALISLKVPGEDKASLSVSSSADEDYWLRVAFIDNIGAPDIFKIEPGQF